jgi:hypothetical protein
LEEFGQSGLRLSVLQFDDFLFSYILRSPSFARPLASESGRRLNLGGSHKNGELSGNPWVFFLS